MEKLYKITGLIVLLFTPFMISSCYLGVSGNGHVEERTVNVDEFTRLEIDGNFDVYIQQGSQAGLKIEADENLHELIEVKNFGSLLEIHTRDNILRAKKKSLYITCTDLEKAELNGAINFRTEKPLDLRTLAVFVSGASDIRMDIKAEKIWLEVSGAADCDLRGKAGQLDLDLSGAGEFNAIDLESREAAVTMSGAGTAKVWATEELRVDISGAGSVRYKGDPRISKSIAGIGSLKRY